MTYKGGRKTTPPRSREWDTREQPESKSSCAVGSNSIWTGAGAEGSPTVINLCHRTAPALPWQATGPDVDDGHPDGRSPSAVADPHSLMTCPRRCEIYGDIVMCESVCGNHLILQLGEKPQSGVVSCRTLFSCKPHYRAMDNRLPHCFALCLSLCVCVPSLYCQQINLVECFLFAVCEGQETVPEGKQASMCVFGIYGGTAMCGSYPISVDSICVQSRKGVWKREHARKKVGCLYVPCSSVCKYECECDRYLLNYW